MQPFAFLGFGVTIVPLTLLVLVVVLIVGGRREADPEQQRPAAIYYALVQFVTIFVVLFALFAMTASLLNLTTDGSAPTTRGFQSFSPPSIGPGGRSIIVGPDGGLDQGVFRSYDSRSPRDHDWANAVRALIVVLVAGAIFALHERRRPRFPPGTPGHRVWKTYLYAVSFVAVIIVVTALTGGLFKLWGGIAPGVTGDGPRSHAFRDAGSIVFLALTAGLLFWRHLSWAEPRRPRQAAATPPPAWPPPAAPAAATAPAAPVAQRRRPPAAKQAPARRTPPPRKRSTD